MPMAEDSKFWERTSLNATINIVRTVVTALIGVLMVPYYIDTLGIATYGLIPLATAMSSYIMIISDSLVSACYRYVMMSFEDDDSDKIIVTYNTALFGIGRNQLLLIPVVLLFAFLSPYMFNISGTAAFDVQMMFCLMLLSTLIVTYCSAMNSIFYAVNKLYILYAIRIFYIVVQVLLIVLLFCVSTPSLIEVGFAYLVSAFLFFLLIRHYSRRLYPGMEVDRKYYDPILFRQIGSLGAWTILKKLGKLLFIQISLILTNLYLGSVIGGGFAIVTNMISMLDTACFSITAIISPLIYRVQADKDPQVMIDVTSSYLKIVSLLCSFPIAFVLVFCPQILGAWVGDGYSDLSKLVAIAYLAELVYIVSTIVDDITIIYLKVKQVCVMTLFFGTINVVSAIVMMEVFDMGSTGVIVAWAASTSMLSLTILVYSTMLIGARPWAYLFPVFLGYAVMSVCYLVMDFLSEYVVVEPTWMSIIIWFLILFMVYLPFMIRLLNEGDRKEVMKIAPSFCKGAIATLFRYL